MDKKTKRQFIEETPLIVSPHSQKQESTQTLE